MNTHPSHRLAGTVRLISSLRCRPFAWLWVGQTISEGRYPRSSAEFSNALRDGIHVR